ncbi:MAG: DUF6756 family protein [Candidatus Thorarchaeota archaeon]
MAFFSCFSIALEKHNLRQQSVERVSADTEDIVASILDFASGENGGQLRRDCTLRRFNLASFILGIENGDLSDDERLKLKGTKVRNIYLGKREETYTIIGQYYVELMQEVLPKKREPVWFLASFSYQKWVPMRGDLDSFLVILNECWFDIYEFYIVPKDFSWLVHYEHHHNIYFLGDEIANAAYNRKDRRHWADRIINHGFYLSDTNLSKLG